MLPDSSPPCIWAIGIFKKAAEIVGAKISYLSAITVTISGFCSLKYSEKLKIAILNSLPGRSSSSLSSIKFIFLPILNPSFIISSSTLPNLSINADPEQTISIFIFFLLIKPSSIVLYFV